MTTGFVLCHGFTGHPASMQPWADDLAARGFAVDVPLLPGHGTTWQDLNTKRWPDFFATLEHAYLTMADRCDQVVVGGLSMGGALAVRLAEVHHPAGIVLVNPALETKRIDARFAKPASVLIRSVPAIGDDIKKPGVSEHAYPRTPLRAFASVQDLWKVTLRELPAIRCPVLVLRSVDDHTAPGSGTVDLLRAGAASTDVTEVLLHDSFHVATLDNDAPRVFEESAAFAERVS